MSGVLSCILNCNNSASSSGSVILSTVGTYTWQVPAGVTSISVLTVGAGSLGEGGAFVCCCCGSNYGGYGGGGGALAYTNNISVTPLSTISVTIGSGFGVTFVSFGTYAKAFSGNGVLGGAVSIGTGGAGGNGSAGSPNLGHGGGGAGGYGGSGGAGGTSSGTAGTGGAGGGAAMGGAGGAGGGGVGLFGAGSSGASGTQGATTANGKAGSGGSDGNNTAIGILYVYGANGGAYGGGGGGGYGANANQGLGGAGAIRIVWPGTTRQFPSTNVGTV